MTDALDALATTRAELRAELRASRRANSLSIAALCFFIGTRVAWAFASPPYVPAAIFVWVLSALATGASVAWLHVRMKRLDRAHALFQCQRLRAVDDLVKEGPDV